MPEGYMSGGGPRKLLWVAMGRQRSGKTALLNTAAQYFRAGGAHIEIWNADQQNRTHTLSTFFPDAAEPPPGGGLIDGRTWIEQQLADQTARGYHAVLDVGGGFTGFSSLVKDVPVIDDLAARGVEVIGVFMAGTERADLDYLDDFATSGAFLPKATVIVANHGLVLSGRSPAAAFAPVMASKVIEKAVSRGAVVVSMPSLTCMSEVTDRGLLFEDAAAGRVKPGQAPMALFDPTRVREWWTKKIPAFFNEFPPEWLPVPAVGPALSGQVGEAG